MRLRTIVLVQIALGILSCSPSKKSTDEGREVVKSEKTIYKDEYGNEWPFTVDKGVLKCSSNQVLFIVNGKHYAINGTAQSLAQSHGYSSLEEIWAYDSEEMTTRISIGRIIQDGLSLCN